MKYDSNMMFGMRRIHSDSHRTRSSQGFTLIELLVVVAIISLLVSILLPSLTKARDLAKLTVCATNERSIGTAAHMYTTDYDGQLFSCVPSGNMWGFGLPWNRMLLERGYLGDTTVMHCPAHVPKDATAPENLRSYIVNGWITGGGYAGAVQANIDDLPYGRMPAEMNLLDEVWRGIGGGINTERENTHYEDCDENLCWQAWIHNSSGYTEHMPDRLVNFLFLDGHVAAYEHVFTPTIYPKLLYDWYFYPWN